jgi:hypothetical protein
MVEGVGDRGRAGRLLAPLALILSQDLGLILGAQAPIPERELDLGARQTFLHINSPAPNFDKAASIGHPLTIPLPKGPLEIGRFNVFASGVSERFQR